MLPLLYFEVVALVLAYLKAQDISSLPKCSHGFHALHAQKSLVVQRYTFLAFRYKAGRLQSPF